MKARRISSNAQALDAFLTAKADFDTMLLRLKALSEDHFGTHPDKITWANVRTLNHYASHLRQVTDSAFKECEYANVPPLSGYAARPRGNPLAPPKGLALHQYRAATPWPVRGRR